MTLPTTDRSATLSIAEAIHTRRTIFKFRPEPVPKDVLEKILEAGIWAPNHHITEPWRFTVIGEQTKAILARRYREIQMAKVAGVADAAQLENVGQKGWEKFMSKPTILAVSCVQEGDEQQRREDYAATCCAMMNVQLMAWSLGVGMQWSTGEITMERNTYNLLGIDPEREYIIGFVYTGYPDEIPPPNRKPLSEVLHWTP